MKNVLVLNQDFSPLAICNVQRAFLLMFLNKAELISEVKDKKLRSVSRSFPFPSVIRISKYVSAPYRGVILTRHNVFKRDNYECQYCGTRKDLTIDHLVPRSLGGKSNWTNLVTACKGCNSRKGDLLIEKTDFQLKKAPVKPSFLMFIRNIHIEQRLDWAEFLESKAYQ
ncbi:MAG: HNH endonuclease [Cyclobacteriaceae bacterium]